MKNLYILMCFVLMSSFAMAQNASLSGNVSSEDGPAIGAIVKLSGTSMGAITDLDGNFMISDIPAGNYDVVVSSVGYEEYSSAVSLSSGQAMSLGNVTLSGGSLALQGVEIIADIAIDRKTPVAVSNISGDYVEQRIGNQEIGELLTVTPSVYATKQGGGAGDSRIVVRGFDQRNTVYMINGIPVNDMENGWVYWSNWAGLSDVMRNIQVQRGLGASLLANPSVGGTVNLITKTTDMKAGGHAFASVGNDLFRKKGVTFSTGNVNDWAFTFSGSRTTSNGYVNGTFNDAYSYFGSISKDFKNHSLVFTGLGAPQRHGQRTFAENLSSYVPNQGTGEYSDFISNAKAGDHNLYNDRNSIRWGSSWGQTDRAPILGSREDDYINERTNFYHKPQLSLNHYWEAKDNIFVATSLYGSWGRGGGTGPRGNIQTFRSQWRTGDQANTVDWGSVLEANSQVANGIGDFGSGEDFYILRASMNEHNWYGALSKAIIELNDDLTLTTGLDYRTYEGLHYRKVVDLMGLNGFLETNWQDGDRVVGVDSKVYGLSDENNKIHYDNDGLVDWLGGFSELEYSTDKVTLTFGGALSNKQYQRVDRQNYAEGDPLRTSDKYDFLGYTVKGGAGYNINSNHTVFANAGYLSVAPIFDAVFTGFNNELSNTNPDAENEKTLGIEGGYRFTSKNVALNFNGYWTQWKDKSFVRRFTSDNGDNFFANLNGIEALHKGLELDARVEPFDWMGVTAMVAVNDWQWKNNVQTDIFDDDNNLVDNVNVYIEDLKVGNAPQTQFALLTDFEATKNISLDATYRYFADYYADFDPEGRTVESNIGVQSVQLPDYGLVDLGATVNIPVSKTNQFYVRANIFNVLDELYVSDGQDRVGGSLQDIRGYFGQGRTWTTAMGIRFSGNGEAPAEVNIPMPAPAVEVNMDSDNDGVLDASDKCPQTPGSLMGCPDTDGDGVADSDDDCVTEAGLAVNNGCPVEMEMPEPQVIVEERVVEVEVNSDSDGDGVVDSKDNCPTVAGEITNYGCPVVAAPVVVTPSVEVVKEINFIAKSILFNTNSDALKTESRVKLDEMASIMMQYPNTNFVVEGHTDNTGDAGYNKTLSQKRAQSVVNYLVGKGISGSSLAAMGYGQERPIASNDTSAGRQQNRRVVIKLR